MTFQEKSTGATLVAMVAAYSVYWIVLSAAADSTPLTDVPFVGPLIVMTVVLVVLIIGAHVLLAMASPRTAGNEDERDRLIELRGGEVGGVVLGVAVFAAILLVIVDVDRFWLANSLLAGLVLAELAESLTKLVLYRRGV